MVSFEPEDGKVTQEIIVILEHYAVLVITKFNLIASCVQVYINEKTRGIKLLVELSNLLVK
jgi:hypothetical protein